MTTIAKNLDTGSRIFSPTKTTHVTPSAGLFPAYARFIKNLEFWHFSVISAAILFGSCLGSIATMKVFETGAPIWQFALSLAVTMANLVACISQAPTKWVVNLFALSIVVNTILLLLNIL